MRESEKEFRIITDSAPALIAHLDAERRYLFTNKTYESWFGISREQARGKYVWEIHGDDGYARLKPGIDRALSGKRSTFDMFFPETKVGPIHVQGDLVPDFDEQGKVRGYFVLTLDVTERKRMEQELRKLAQVVEQSPESIVITNPDAEIEYVNQAFVQQSGYSREELLGRNPSIMQSGKTSPEQYRALWAALNRGRPWQGEFYNRRKDGSEFVASALIAPLSQPGGGISHYFAVSEDITEQKRLAEELENHRHGLEALVQQRTAHLIAAGEQAEAANRAKSAFLANMSHEIRTPLNAIVGFTQLLQESDLQPEKLEHLAKIDDAAGHLLTIIEDILDLSKIEAGKLNLEQTDFHLGTILDQVKSLLYEQTHAKELRMEVEQDSGLTWLRGDPTRLRQALLNYASSAVKFTAQGTITLRARQLDRQGEEFLVRFEVQDTGIGIAPAKLTGLFRPFEQADTSTTRIHGGSGLGLAITRHLAQLMGGEAGAESEPGRGSTFWFTARLCRGQAIESAASSAELQPAPRHLDARILLAEDNAINREVAVAMLASVGLTVDTAENGRVAVTMARATDYNLVLMDLQMPEMDGLEATRMIRCMAGKENLPILAMTAAVFQEDCQACLEAGMNGFIAKPIKLGELIATIARWLPQLNAVAEVAPFRT